MNLLDRAKKLLQNRASSAAAVQYYHVFCPAGHRLSGARTEGYQALRCPTCGEGIFILPRSPLPEPAAPENARSSSRPETLRPPALNDEPIALQEATFATSGAADAGAEIDWSEPKPRPARGPRPAGPPREPRPQTGRKAESAAARTRREPEPDDDRPAREPFRVGAWARRRRNPLIFVAVVAVMIAAVSLRARRSRFEDYPRDAEIGRTEGLKALGEGRLDAAYLMLSKARRAVEALGGDCEGAAEILQGAREAEIFTKIVPDPLEVLIDRADPAEGSAWPRDFANLYKGRFILIDAHLTAVPGEDGASQFDLDYRIFPNGEGPSPRRVGRIDLAGFKLFEQAGLKKGSDVLFGARLASMTYDSGRDEWVVGLEPDSGTFITHHDALRALWPASEENPAEARP